MKIELLNISRDEVGLMSMALGWAGKRVGRTEEQVSVLVLHVGPQTIQTLCIFSILFREIPVC